jgi:site-specific DNA recombinase
MVRLVNDEMDAACSEYGGKLEAAVAETEDVNRRLERLYDALETGKLTMNDLSPRIQQLRERQKQLNAVKWEMEALLADRQLEVADEKTVRQVIEELWILLGESPLAERRSFIRGFLSEVKVTGD